jgi:hypothetical protein
MTSDTSVLYRVDDSLRIIGMNPTTRPIETVATCLEDVARVSQRYATLIQTAGQPVDPTWHSSVSRGDRRFGRERSSDRLPLRWLRLRQPARPPERIAQHGFDLPVERAQIVIRPSLQRVEYGPIHPQEKRFALSHRGRARSAEDRAGVHHR